MTVRRLLLSVVLVAGLVVVGYWAYSQFLAPVPEPPRPTLEPDRVAIDTGVDVVSAEGTVVPSRHARLGLAVGGTVAEVLVETGRRVEAGEPLLRLDASELTIGLQQATAAVGQAEAGVAAAEAGVRAAAAGVMAAETAVIAAEANLALVQAEPPLEEVAALEANIAAAEAALAQVAANRDLILAGPTTAQLRAAEARVAAAFAEEATIQDQYDTILRNDIGGPTEEQTRFALNAASANLAAARAALEELQAGAREAERRAVVAAVSVAVGQRDAAQAQLDLRQAGPLAEQVEVATVEVDRARTAVLQAEASQAQAEAAVAQAQATLAQAEAARDAAALTLERATLKAPFAGTVVDRAVEVGELVTPGAPLVTLADLSSWQVETTDLTELDVVAVAVGFPVDVRIDAIPDRTLVGVVQKIAAVSAITRGDVTYAVTIDLTDTAGLPLRWGMTAFVDVKVGGQ